MDTASHRISNAALPAITLDLGFDNTNPRDPGAIQAEEDGTFVVRHFVEENCPEGYSFHFHVAVNNDGDKPETVPFRIRWSEPDFDFCHDYMYIGYDSGREWVMLSTPCVDSVTEMKLVVPPGRHLFCHHPKFDVGDYLALVDRMAATALFERVEVGESAEGHPVACLRCGNPNGRKTVITTRAHGYESAGAHCMDGWFRQAVSDPAAVEPVLAKLDLYFFHLLNVDAVAHGRCCFGPSGVNFGNELALRTDDDVGAKALTTFIFGLEPAFYLDMHNNTGPHLRDSFRVGDEKLLEAFWTVAADRSRDQKTWGGRYVASFSEGYMLRACQRRFNTLPMLTEFPWYTRRPQEMRAHGREFFNALLPLLADWPTGVEAVKER